MRKKSAGQALSPGLVDLGIPGLVEISGKDDPNGVDGAVYVFEAPLTVRAHVWCRNLSMPEFFLNHLYGEKQPLVVMNNGRIVIPEYGHENRLNDAAMMAFAKQYNGIFFPAMVEEDAGGGKKLLGAQFPFVDFVNALKRLVPNWEGHSAGRNKDQDPIGMQFRDGQAFRCLEEEMQYLDAVSIVSSSCLSGKLKRDASGGAQGRGNTYRSSVDLRLHLNGWGYRHTQIAGRELISEIRPDADLKEGSPMVQALYSFAGEIGKSGFSLEMGRDKNYRCLTLSLESPRDIDEAMGKPVETTANLLAKFSPVADKLSYALNRYAVIERVRRESKVAMVAAETGLVP